MGFAGILIVVIVSFLVLCVVLAWLNDRSTKARKDVINAVLDAVNGMEHFQTDEHYFTEDFTTGIALDLERGKICLMRKELARMHTCVGDIEEVISCEVVITQGMPRTEGTSKTTGLLGGWLLGGFWGAVVGSAVTGQRAVGHCGGRRASHRCSRHSLGHAQSRFLVGALRHRIKPVSRRPQSGQLLERAHRDSACRREEQCGGLF